MKTRHGFVSNSSSSSFIIETKEQVTSPKELEYLFKDFKFYNATVTKAESARYAFANLEHVSKWEDWTIEELLQKDNDGLKKFTTQYLKSKLDYYEEFIKVTNEYDKIYDSYIGCRWGENLTEEELDTKFPTINQMETFLDSKYDEVYKLKEEAFRTFYKDSITKLNKKNIYLFKCSGNGEGWTSKECNGIYETSREEVFIEPNKIKTAS